MKIVIYRHFDQEWADSLSEFKPEFIPLFETQNLAFDPKLLHEYAGVILTSKRALIPSGYQGKVYAVGPSTGRALTDIGYSPFIGSGTAESLAQMVLSDGTSPCLFLRGDKSLDVIPSQLTGGGLIVDSLVVYSTHPLTIHPHDPDLAVFFSPSGVDHVSASGIKPALCISIGPTTHAAIQCLGWRCHQASSPTPTGVLEAIRSLK